MEARLLIRYFIYSTVLLLLQVLLFNYVSLGTGLVPFVYIMILLFFPIETHKALPLIFAFVFGLSLDFLNDTVALNTGALVFIAFIRPSILQLLSPDNGYEVGRLPSFYNMGLKWFVIYSLIMIFFHQFIYFSLEIFSLAKIHIIFFKTIVNTLYSFSFIILLHILIFKNK